MTELNESTHQPALTSTEIRAWLRHWISKQAGLPESEITDDRPLEQLGLASKDVVLLSGELEKLMHISLEPTVAYEYSTVGTLADHIASVAAGGAEKTATQQWQPAASQALDPDNHDIAIVGFAVRYPGAESPEQMWDLLIHGQDAMSEPPTGRWAEFESDTEMMRRLHSIPLTGGYLPDIAQFDAEFFGISPVEAVNMDPQQRILLELTWEALNRAGIPADTLRGREVGVFMGSTNNDYGMLLASDSAESHPYALTGCSTSVIANRISYAFDFRGPSVTVDTACSSSLVAIHDAVRALRYGDADAAVAGGINILAHPLGTAGFGELGVLSPTGKIRAFSKDADGIVRSDGAGVIILKRLKDARAAGDNVLAVIKGSAVTSDGRSNGLTAPNPDAQVDVLRRAYADAGVDPANVDYVEAHGTGTILGDPIEATALGRVLGAGRPTNKPTLLGSAKTNFGHTEAAAGVAGVAKVILALEHNTLPPTANFAGPNPYIDFDADRLEVVEDAREWPEYSGRAIAGVSGFGFGGTNAHVVIAAPDPADRRPELRTTAAGHSVDKNLPTSVTGASASAHALLPVSGQRTSRRVAEAELVRAYLGTLPRDAGVEALRPLERALTHRGNQRSRAIAQVGSVAEAIDAMDHLIAGKASPVLAVANAPARGGAAWVYTGFGSQHRMMGKELYQTSRVFRDSIDAADAIIQRESGWSLVERILDDAQSYDTETAQVGITAIQIALTDLMHAMGARPTAVVGMSMGEIAAAYAAGGLNAADALTIACHRARLMGEKERSISEDNRGAMAVVEFSVEDLDAFIIENPEFAKIEPAVYASPGMITVGGPFEAVKELTAYVEGEGKFAKMLNVRGAGHTSALDSILGELYAECSAVTPQPVTVPVYSSVDRGRTYQPGEIVHTPEYFVRCTRHPVWYGEAIGRTLDAGVRTFVEVSPNPVGLMQIMQTAYAHNAGDANLLYLQKRKEDSLVSVQNVAAQLWVHGQPVDLRQLTDPGERADIPPAVWKHQRFWTAARPADSAGRSVPGVRVALPDGRVAYSVRAEVVPSLSALIEATAQAEAPGHPVVRIAEKHTLPPSGELTTIVTTTMGGVGIEVHRVMGTSFQMLGEAFVSTLPAADSVGESTSTAPAGAPDLAGGLAEPQAAYGQQSVQPVAGYEGGAGVAGGVPADPRVNSGGAFAEVDRDESLRWNPNSGESVAERLQSIVSESMGYDIQDLPRELPLIDLGLDSLMGMRIKNRIEYEFSIPPLQVQALRDASVDDVISLVAQLVEDSGVLGTAGATADIPSAGMDGTPGPDGVSGMHEAGAGAAQQGATAQAAPAAQGTAGTDGGAQPENATPVAAGGVGVAPRDASERMVFGTWSTVVGAAPLGVTSPLPQITDTQAAAIAARLNERSGAAITAEMVSQVATLEPLANVVRESFETDVQGNIRVLRERPEGSNAPAVFLFHPAGGSSTVYQPLARRLPKDVPVYGVERLEGSLDERANAYVDDIVELAGDYPVILGGWSFGGFLAYAVALRLKDKGVDVRRLLLLDAVQPAHPAPDTLEEVHARWDRYAAFCDKTYGLDLPVPHELIDEYGEEALLEVFSEFLKNTDPAEHGLSAGVLEHQRASFVDNRIMATVNSEDWKDVGVPVTLFRAERMHDGAIELEPAYAEISEDGGWAPIISDLEILHLVGDHLAVVDEPEIGKVGARLTEIIKDIEATSDTEK